MTAIINTLINSNPGLSNEEVKVLCYKMHNSKDSKERYESRNKFALSFSRYAYSFCNSHFLKGNITAEGFEDMFNDILEVLLEKAWDYNPEHANGACFITFVAPYVQHAVLKSFNEEKSEYYVRTMNAINHAVASYVETYQEQPSLEEISELTGYSMKVIKNAYALKENYITASIYTPAGGDEDCSLTLGDLATGSATIHIKPLTPEEALYGRAMNAKLLMGIKELDFVERFAVENFDLSERKAVKVLSEEFGIVIGRTTYQNRKKNAVRKLCEFMETDHINVMAA